MVLDWSRALAALNKSILSGKRTSISLMWMGIENEDLVTEILS
jgi:hypothetical protein